MAENGGKTWWTPKKAKAAQLIAEGRLTQAEIAAMLAVGLRSVERWARCPAFQSRLSEITAQTAEQLRAQGVRLKQNRVNRLQARLEKMDALIDARATEMGESKEIAGGETGLLTRDHKGKGKSLRAVYRLDAALLREMREHEKQAAIELGEWTEKRDLTSDGKSLGVVFLPQAPRTVEEWQELCQREITPSSPAPKGS